MPVKGLEAAKRATTQIVVRITGELSLQTIQEVMIIGAGYASTMTPVDTSLLLNSQYREVFQVFGATRGRVGFTAAYAAAVNAMSGKLKGQPRAHFGVTRAGVAFGGGTGVGNYWDPGGEPDFLRKGFEDADAKADINAAVKRGMTI